MFSTRLGRIALYLVCLIAPYDLSTLDRQPIRKTLNHVVRYVADLIYDNQYIPFIKHINKVVYIFTTLRANYGRTIIEFNERQRAKIENRKAQLR